jgi:hypothetical protein
MAATDWKFTEKGVLVEACHTSGAIVLMRIGQPWRKARLLNAPPEWKPHHRLKIINEARALSGCDWNKFITLSQ